MTDPLSLLLSPVMLAQGLWVRWRIPRLPEAPGARAGQLGNGRPLSLLILGDSAAAGVGIDHQSKALAGQLSQALADGYEVTWRLKATSGITTEQAHRLLNSLDDEHFDVVLLSLGVNDVLTWNCSPANWQRKLENLCNRLSRQGAQVLVTELPPLDQFERLPQPLRHRLGYKSSRFNQRLRRWADGQPGLTLLQLDAPSEGEALAADGFHPGEALHRQWAQKASALIRSLQRQ